MISRVFRFRLVQCLVVACVAFQLLLGGVGTVLGEEGKLLLAAAGTDGKKAPDFELQDLSGKPVKLSQYRGDRAVMMYFWATWCPYCVAAKPKVAKLRREISEKDMEILGINVGSGDSLERLKRFQEGHPSNWPILYDGDSKVSKLYGVQGIPLFVIVDKDGNEVYRGNGFPEDPMKYLK